MTLCFAPAPVIVWPHTPVSVGACLLAERRVRQLVVVEVRTGRPAGLVHDLDLFSRGRVPLRSRAWRPHREEDDGLTIGELSVHTARVVDEAPIGDWLSTVEGAAAVLVVDRAGVVKGTFTEADAISVSLSLLDPRVRVQGRREVATVSRVTPVRWALARMRAERVRHLVVTDAAGCVEGIVASSDVCGRPDHTTVGDVASMARPITVRQGVSLASAGWLLGSNHIGCLPVVDARGRIERLVTRTDIIAAARAARSAFRDPRSGVTLPETKRATAGTP